MTKARRSIFLKIMNIDAICFVILILIQAYYHFSITPILTYDSMHYHTYLPILSGDTPWSNWDVVRGPLFPLLIYWMRTFLGTDIQSVAIFNFIFLFISFSALFVLINRHIRARVLRVLAYLLLSYIFIDPVVAGYYNTLLTESVASTLAIIATLVASIWISTPLSKNPKFIFYSLVLILLPAIGYHIKQPWFMTGLFPFLGATVISYIERKEGDKGFVRIAIFMCSIVFLFLSIILWNGFLPKSGQAAVKSRTTSGMLIRTLITGAYFKDEGVLVDKSITVIKRDRRIPKREKEHMVSIKRGLKVGDPTCARIIALLNGEYEVKTRLLVNCHSGRISVLEGVIFTFKTIYYNRESLFRNYYYNLLVLANITPKKYQNHLIAHRSFKVSTLSPNLVMHSRHYGPYLGSYRSTKPPSKYSWWVYKKISHFSDILFLVVIASLIPIGIIIALFYIYTYIGCKTNLPSVKVHLVFIISFYTVWPLFFHMFVNRAIDRYAFPSFPIGAFLYVFIIVSYLDYLSKYGGMWGRFAYSNILRVFRKSLLKKA